jgi:hypothetical protein
MTHSVLVQLIKGWPLIAPLGPADTVILINLDNLVASTSGDLTQLTLLALGVLVIGGDSQIKGSAGGPRYWKFRHSAPHTV